MKKSLLISLAAASLALGTYSTQASAHDPVAGALVGTAIGAAAGGPVGAAVGAIIGTIISSDHHFDRDRRYYDRGYRYDRGPVSYEPVPAPAYREPVRYYERPAYRDHRDYRDPREYREPARYYDREAPRYYEARNYEYREAPRYYREEPRYSYR